MFFLALLTLVIASFVLSAASSPATNHPSPLISQPLQIKPNLSNPLVLQGGPDPDFGLRGDYGDESVNIISLLMNAVSGLAELAHQPYHKHIPGGHVTALPKYSNVDISLQPVAPTEDIEVRVAVDSLFYMINDMIKTKRFRNADFEVLWDRRVVARILITKSTGPSTTVRGITNQTQGSITAVGDLEEGPNSLSTGVDYFFEYVPNGATLTYQEVFITIMATLKNLAEWPSNDVVEPFRSGAAGFNARMQFLSDETPRTKPPFLRYEYLIDTVKAIPDYMLGHKKFAELGILVSYGDELIGQALLEKGSPELGDAGGTQTA